MLAAASALGILVGDALRLRNDLEAARDVLTEARDAATDGNLDDARLLLAAARGHVTDATEPTRRLLWTTTERLPALGSALATMSGTVEVVDAGLELGYEVLAAVAELVGGNERPAVIDGRLDLGPIRRAGARLADVDTSRLESSLDRLERASTLLLPTELRDGRREMLLMGEQALELFTRSHSLLDVLPDFLGQSGTRSYLVALQNPAELRGTGGLIGYLTTVEVTRGRFEVGPSVPVNELRRDRTDQATLLRTGRADKAFLDRYGPAQAATFLSNVNLDPDVPTTAHVLLGLFAALEGDRLDGVILVDPVALGRVLDVVGPVELPAGVDPRDRRLPNPMTGDRVAQAVLVDQYEVFGGREPARKAWLEALSAGAFEALFTRPWKPADLVSVLAGMASTGHLQAYSTNPDEQQAIANLRLGGTLRHREGTDLVAVTANNTAANKADAHVAHRQRLAISLARGDDGQFYRTADLTVSVVNPLPTTGLDEYIIGSAPVTGATPGLIGERGLTRTWFSVWVPPDAELFSLQDQADESTRAGVYDIHQARVVDHVLEVPSETAASFRVAWSGPAHTTDVGDALTYTLRWQRQGKAIPDRIEATITTPAGFRVAQVEMAGGGVGDGFGPDGRRGPRVRATLESPTRVVIAGDMSADLEVTLRLERTPFLDR